jgi:hypothetical protein
VKVSKSNSGRTAEPSSSRSRIGQSKALASASVMTTLTTEAERQLIANLLSKFPMDEIAARTQNTTKEKDLFTVYSKDGTNVFVLPKNLSDFKDTQLMYAILSAATEKDYVFELHSEKELPPKVLKTEDASFFAGFVRQAKEAEVGTRIEATTRYAKGRECFQRLCVERHFGKANHLHKDGSDRFKKKMSSQTCFTKEFFHYRAAIQTLFLSLRAPKPADLKSFMKSKEELIKGIHTQLSWRNRGVFRPEEITYLDSLFQDSTEALTGFIRRLSDPDSLLAEKYEDEYAAVRTKVRYCENQVTGLINRRASIVFIPNSKKKKDIEWNKKKLLEKLALIEAKDKITPFMPTSLPGIVLERPIADVFAALSLTRLQETYALGEDPLAAEVVTSWNQFLTGLSRDESAD